MHTPFLFVLLLSAVAQAETPLPPTWVTFQSEEADRFTVSVEGLSCVVPCQLPLQEGRRVVRTIHSGASTWLFAHDEDHLFTLDVPDVNMTVRFPSARIGSLAAGAILVILAHVSLVMLIDFDVGCATSDSRTCLAWSSLGWAGAAAVTGTAGISLLVHYATRDRDVLIEPAAPPHPAVSLTSVGFLPVRGGGVAGLTLSF